MQNAEKPKKSDKTLYKTRIFLLNFLTRLFFESILQCVIFLAVKREFTYKSAFREEAAAESFLPCVYLLPAEPRFEKSAEDSVIGHTRGVFCTNRVVPRPKAVPKMQSALLFFY